METIHSEKEKELVESARDFLAGYRLCEDMLHLRKYERKRLDKEEVCHCEEILCGCEALWRSRMEEVRCLLTGMKNGREKMILYYHYIRGESIERASDLLGFSRRTGYRAHRHALLVVGATLKRLKK